MTNPSGTEGIVAAAIEAAAIELHVLKNPDGPEWEGASERHKNRCRGAVKKQTEAALSAALQPTLDALAASQAEEANLTSKFNAVDKLARDRGLALEEITRQRNSVQAIADKWASRGEDFLYPSGHLVWEFVDELRAALTAAAVVKETKP